MARISFIPTDNNRVFTYLRRFSGWIGYQHKSSRGLVRHVSAVPFNKNSMEIAFEIAPPISSGSSIRSATSTGALSTSFAQEDPNWRDRGLRLQNVFLYYAKGSNGGVSPDGVGSAITARVPSTFRVITATSRSVSGMPAMGYTKLFENMLDRPREHRGVPEFFEASVFDLVFEDGSEDACIKGDQAS